MQASAHVFLSHSGARSKQVARVLHDWLPQVLQSVTPFMSEKDISAGSVWFEEVGKKLENAHFAIICVTPENITRPWLNFEAGAIGMTRDEDGVRRPAVPYLMDLEPQDLPQPLAAFEAVKANEEGTRAMIESLNQQLPNPLTADHLRSAFTKWWPDLEAKLSEVPASTKGEVEAAKRTPAEVTDEVLNLVRSIDNQLTGLSSALVVVPASSENPYLQNLFLSPAVTGAPYYDQLPINLRVGLSTAASRRLRRHGDNRAEAELEEERLRQEQAAEVAWYDYEHSGQQDEEHEAPDE